MLQQFSSLHVGISVRRTPSSNPLVSWAASDVYKNQHYGYMSLLIAHGRLERDPATGKSGRERVAQKMQEADILILLHGCDEWCSEYIPSKFYDYLWARRPIWAITHRNPQLDQMLRDRGSYLSADGDDEGIANTLEQIWLDWKAKQLITPIYNPIGVDQAVNTILGHLYS